MSCGEYSAEVTNDPARNGLKFANDVVNDSKINLKIA